MENDTKNHNPVVRPEQKIKPVINEKSREISAPEKKSADSKLDCAELPKSHTFQQALSTDTDSKTVNVDTISQPNESKKESTTLTTPPNVGSVGTKHLKKAGLYTPAHVGEMTEEEAEKEILEAPSARQTLQELIIGPEEKQAEEEEKKEEYHFDKEAFKRNLKKNWEDFKKIFVDHPKIGQTFQAFWMLMMSGVYACGIVFFTLFFVLYFAFTPLLKKYLTSKGLPDVDFTITSNTLSELHIKDISDKSGLFSIQSLRLQYVFTKLLKGQITLAEIDTLNLFIKEDKEKGYDLAEILGLFFKLNIMDANSLIKIQSLQFKNSKIYIGPEKKQIPIDFSGLGDLEEKKQFVIPFAIQNEYINSNATLTTNLEGNGSTVWTVTMDKGRLTLPESPAESLKGTIIWKTKGKDLLNIAADIKINQDQQKKSINLQITPVSGGKFNINLDVSIPAKMAGKNPIQIFLGLRNAEIGSNFKSLSTKNPLNIKISEFKTNFFQTETIQSSLNGDLDCKQTSCSFKLIRPSDVIIFSPSKMIFNSEVKASYPIRISIAPSAQKENFFTIKGSDLSINALMNKVSLNLTKKTGTGLTSNITLSSPEIFLKTALNFFKETRTLSIRGKDVAYADDSMQFEKGTVNILTDEAGSLVTLKTPHATLQNNAFLKIPFSLDFDINPENYFNFSLSTNNKQVSIVGEGLFNPQTGEVLTFLESKPIIFDTNTLTPSQISEIINPRFSNISGKIMFKGQVHWKNNRNISGPMNVLFDKVSFNFDDMVINEMTTMAEITSFLPFGTKRYQEAFMQSLTASLPFRDVSINYFFDSERKQFNISKMNMSFGDIPLRLDPSWISYQAPVQIFNFKAKEFNLNQILPISKIKDLNLQGKASASFSLQLEKNKNFLKNMEITIPTEGLIEYSKVPANMKNLSVLKKLQFRRSTILVNELNDESTDFLFLGYDKNSTNTHKTSIRFNVSQPLSNFFNVGERSTIPKEVLDKLKKFNQSL